MATYEEIRQPYEMLFRFADGVIKGGHVKFIELIVVDGVVKSAREGDAEPLDLEGFPTSSIVNDLTRDAIAEVDRLHGEVARVIEDASKERAEAAAATQAADQTIATLEQSLSIVTGQKLTQAARAAAAEERLAETQKLLSEAHARIAGLEGAIAAVSARDAETA